MDVVDKLVILQLELKCALDFRLYKVSGVMQALFPRG